MLLQTATRVLGRRSSASRTSRAVDDRPGCAFGLALDRTVQDLVKDFDRLETKVNGVLFGVVTTLLVELWRGWR